MLYSEFAKVMTTHRMSRYLMASGGDSRKAMTLYRKNLLISQELFTIIGCFEIALRNAIDEHYLKTFGNDWLRSAAIAGGIFDHIETTLTKDTINDGLRKLKRNYTHSKLVAELGFGFWRFMFAPHQYARAGQTLLRIFPSKPKSTQVTQYNNSYIFNELANINKIRNRIAHHEPICFTPLLAVKNTIYVRQNYGGILQLFQWMNIDEHSLLYGLDHITSVCNGIDNM